MGRDKKNTYAGPHWQAGSSDGYGCVIGRETPALHNPSPSITSATTWASYVSSAKQSESALVTAASGTAFGTWLSGLSALERADVVAAMADLPSSGR